MTSLSSKVLVVEDDDEIRESLLELLEEHGYPAAGVSHGKAALDALRADGGLPALILLDVMMPIMDGRAFREEQLKTPELAGIPVVVISAFGDYSGFRDAMAPIAYLNKPLDLAQLLSIVGAHCRSVCLPS